MSEVFLCAQGQLSNRSRSDLRKAGIVVVEVEDETRCQFIRSTELVPADEMLWAVLDALNAKAYYWKDGKKTGRAESSDHQAKLDALATNLLKIVSEQRFRQRATRPDVGEDPA